MKKFLLLSMAVAAGITTATAEIKTPVIYPESAVQRISADGRYMLSEVYGTIKIFDLETGTEVEYAASDDMIEYYSLGLGNCLTPDASIILGSTNSTNDAAYLKDGVWNKLNVPDEEKPNLTNGITPDGRRICGSVGLNDMTFEEVIMQVPAYWDLNEDGTYGNCNVLPYPTKDLFGETPQYVTAISIADDGKTIVGQMVFSSGAMTIPVVYTQADNGEWSYSLPTASLFNPDGIEPVPNPGDGPMPPSYEEYMTPEEIDAYNAAVQDFYNQLSGSYPDYEDYISPEGLAAYNAALEEYQVAYAEWDEKWTAYQEYSDAVLTSSPSFLFNNCLLSTDGKYIVSTLEGEDPNSDPWSWFPQVLYTPCTVELATGALAKTDTELSLLASAVANDGVILAHNGQRSMPMSAYVIKDGEVTLLIDYLNAINPEYGAWINKNMSHEVVVDYDPETWEEIFEELTFTGIPSCTPDLKKIAVWNTSPWDDMENAQSVLFDLNDPSGIAAIGATAKNIKVVANGVISVPAGFSSLDVYNLNGVNVESVAAPSGLVKLNVASGAYIVKAQRADGSVSVIKLAVR